MICSTAAGRGGRHSSSWNCHYDDEDDYYDAASERNTSLRQERHGIDAQQAKNRRRHSDEMVGQQWIMRWKTPS
ncbi:MAG: hypothetical protein H6672_20270 [Anaerolineaceae bacterium]|nr:hypothetical protein [Anaerolineaceae bacterium]